MISQTAHFPGLTPDRLYRAILSSSDHAAMTGDGRGVVEFRAPDGTPRATAPRPGDELRAFGRPNDEGTIDFRLTARLLELVPDERIVMSWRTAAWDAAVAEADGRESTSVVVLRFATNVVGAEIRLDQVGVPTFVVHIPDTGERGPLETIVNTHWSLLYWEPMRRYLASRGRDDRAPRDDRLSGGVGDAR